MGVVVGIGELPACLCFSEFILFGHGSTWLLGVVARGCCHGGGFVWVVVVVVMAGAVPPW